MSCTCFRMLRNQRADVGEDPQAAPQQLSFGVELWPLTPAVLVLSKWNRKRSQLPNARVSVRTILGLLKQDGNPSITAPGCCLCYWHPRKMSPAKCLFMWGKKAGAIINNKLIINSKSVLPQQRSCQKPLENGMNTELIMNKVICEREFQEASLLAGKPEYFQWKHSCL